MQILKTSELQLGDVVQTFDGAYGTSTVEKIDNDTVTFFRPYVHTGDTKLGNRVLCYVGIEQFSRLRQDNQTWKVLDRVALK